MTEKDKHESRSCNEPARFLIFSRIFDYHLDKNKMNFITVWYRDQKTFIGQKTAIKIIRSIFYSCFCRIL